MFQKVFLVIVAIFLATVSAGQLPELTDKEVSSILFPEEEMAPEEDTPADASVYSGEGSGSYKSIQLDSSEEESIRDVRLYSVVRVIDGDTIVIDNAGKQETVRLIGIDTPETVHPSKPVQCFGAQASAQTKEWLEGKRVSIEIDLGEGGRDKYRRLLGYVRREDGLFINHELILRGYAYEYTYDTPYKYQALFREAELSAERAGAGLWVDDVCAGP